jgi:hypothetical protein
MTYAISKAHDIEETTLVMVASITHAVMEINQKTTERQFEMSWYLKLLSKDKINCKLETVPDQQILIIGSTGSME